MLRQGVQPLGALGTRCLSSTTAAAAAPALAKKSFFSQLLGGSNRVTVPMTEAFPGVPELTREEFPNAPVTQTTTLPNGVKIASENTPGATATIGLYVDSGSVYEDDSTTGVSHLLEYLSFKATANRSALRLVREVEGMGGNVVASASREQMAYTIDAPVGSVPEALEVLADAVLNPRFQPWDVSAAAERLESDLKGMADNPQTSLLEGLHTAAYDGALGRPLIAAPGVAAGLSAGTVADFVARNYTAGRIVLAGAGVEHSELVKLAEPLLSGLGGGAGGAPVSSYVGGDWRQYSAGPLTHAILAFEYAGGWRDVQGSVAMTVLQYLLGGGGSFSAGGPGKGMHSRLYTRVLNQYPWMQSCTALNSIYNDSGLVGVFASAESGHAADMVGVLTRELAALRESVPEADLARAKAAARSSVLMNLESRAVVAEDVGRQVLTYGERKPVATFLDAIDALTPADLAKAVQSLLKRPPTLASLGDTAAVPRYDLVAREFA